MLEEMRERERVKLTFNCFTFLHGYSSRQRVLNRLLNVFVSEPSISIILLIMLIYENKFEIYVVK